MLLPQLDTNIAMSTRFLLMELLGNCLCDDLVQVHIDCTATVLAEHGAGARAAKDLQKYTSFPFAKVSAHSWLESGYKETTFI